MFRASQSALASLDCPLSALHCWPPVSQGHVTTVMPFKGEQHREQSHMDSRESKRAGLVGFSKSDCPRGQASGVSPLFFPGSQVSSLQPPEVTGGLTRMLMFIARLNPSRHHEFPQLGGPRAVLGSTEEEEAIVSSLTPATSDSCPEIAESPQSPQRFSQYLHLLAQLLAVSPPRASRNIVRFLGSVRRQNKMKQNKSKQSQTK